MAPRTRSSRARLLQAHSLQTLRTTNDDETFEESGKRLVELPETLEPPEHLDESDEAEEPDEVEEPEEFEDLEDSGDAEDTATPGKSSRNNALRLDLPPIINAHQAFKDLLSNRQREIIAITKNKGFQLRVGTMCSGTEAPVFALKLIKELSQLFVKDQAFLQFDHLFSVENEPFKQAYIARNAPSSIVFRDVVDLADPDATAAPTILGDHREIPRDIDLLVAGTSCVDFSTLNTKKKNSMQLVSTGARLAEEWKKSDQNPENNKSAGNKSAKKQPAKTKPAQTKTAKKNSASKKTPKKKPADKKPATPLREGFFDEVRQWLDGMTPAEIQSTGEGPNSESTVTFLSTVCYINRHRPKMVVVENVSGAPWGSMCGFFFRAIDYAATLTFLDTKDYYIPHTRRRGYVVALDRQVFGDSAGPILNEWKIQLAGLKRGASAPVQDWLLSPQDPLTIRARQDESEKAVASALNPGKDSQWERSKLRHARVRRNLKLGNGRPLTAWGRGGIDQPYDRIDRLVIKGQNDRALDCVDIYYLRCLHADSEPVANSGRSKKPPTGPMQYDIKFKSQIFDLSQNIDRGQINRNFGITGCLTPRGLNLITDQGRLVSGFEALNLQGLPLRDLDLSRETQEELRDLAGNAMTTTVVGAAMFSLLIAVHLHSRDVEPPPLRPITEKEQIVVPHKPLYHPSFEEYPTDNTWIPSTELESKLSIIDLLKRCRRYCYCNGGAKYSTDELVRCKVCDIIRCTSCKGNPTHQFGSLESIKDPIMNDMVPREMMRHFPTALKDVIPNPLDRIPFGLGPQDREMKSLLLGSLQSVTFYYTHVLVSENLTICYSAKDDACTFQLQAVVSDMFVTWYLFLDPWSKCGQMLSIHLGIPAAQMSRPFGRASLWPTGPILPQPLDWEFWVFTEIPFEVLIRRPRPGTVKIDGNPPKNLPTNAFVGLASIIGVYDHYPECDAAEDSLHVNRDAKRKRYLFKDPTRIGLTQEDSYIISDQCRFLEKHEFRDFCVRFPPSWTPKAEKYRVIVSIGGYWERALSSPGLNEPFLECPLMSYTDRVGFRSVPGGSELHFNDQAQRIRTLASVCIDSNMLDDTYMTLLKYEQSNPEKWAVVSRSDYSALFGVLAPVNINFDDIQTTIHLTASSSRQRYFPTLPRVYWMEKTTGGTIREPYRLSSEMRMYEEGVKECCDPFQVAVNIKEGQNKGWKRVAANYEVNVDVLVHGALDHFPKPRDGSTGAHQVETRLKIRKGSLNIPNLKFESFSKSLQVLSGQSSEHNIDFSRLFTPGRALTKQQQISLDWMVDRELSPPPFMEREIEECRSDPLNLRILAVAQRAVSRRGGILADDVGYGKTVVSLALMAAQQSFDQNESRRERGKNKENTLALAASLVLVPQHLVDQWCDEAETFLGWEGSDVLVIKSSRGLQQPLKNQESSNVASAPRAKRPRTAKEPATLLDQFKAAKLIIVSTTVFDDNYYTWLGKYAGSLAHPQKIPGKKNMKDAINLNVLGAFQDWYEDAVIHAREHVSGFDPAVFRPRQLETINRRQQELQESWRVVVADHYDTSTRLGLQTVRNDKTGKSVKGSKEEATVHKEYSDTARADLLVEQDFENNKFMHMLEAFSFARVIYDEFSYENFCVAMFVKNAKAYAKWILSATPPTSNVKAVCDTAELLDIHVARPVKLRPGLPLITEGPMVLRQDPTEKQLSYGKLYTDKSVQWRVKQAHRFLRHFASANPFDEEGLGKISVSEKVLCSYMTRRQLIKYLDFQQDLRNTNLDTSSLLKRHNLDPNFLDDFPSDGRLHAGLGLAYVASVDCADNHGDVATMLSKRRENLEVAKKRLADITGVAVWLVLRRCEEEVKKKNESATNIVEDLACHFANILEANAEDFSGAEALKAVTECTFAATQFSECAAWLKNVDSAARTSEDFFLNFFTLLNKQMEPGGWADYFRLSADRIAGLEESEVSNRIQELSGHGPGPLTPAQAQQHLRELLASKQPRAEPRPQGPEKGPKKTTKRKGRARQKSSPNSADEDRKDAADKKPEYPRFDVRIKIRGGDYTETESELCDIMLKVMEAKEEVSARAKQVTTAENILLSKEDRTCSACGQSCRDMHFLPGCGHFICSSHGRVKLCGEIESKKFPKGSGCPALVPQRTIPASQIDRCLGDVDGRAEPVHSKSRTIFRTIKQIVEENGDDNLLVFYQFDQQVEEIRYLLDHEEIALRPARTQTSDTEEDPKEQIRFLKLNSEMAAGSNIQDANHVLFINTPIFGRQEDFERYVKQAKGRVIRHGQKKHVHIYYFVTVNTFEVDLLQLRKRSHIGIGEHDVAYLFPWDQDARRGTDPDGDTKMADAPVPRPQRRLRSGLSDDEVWKLTDERNWLVQQNREF